MTFVFVSPDFISCRKYEQLLENLDDLNDLSVESRMAVRMLLSEIRVLLERFYNLYILYDSRHNFSKDFIRYWRVRPEGHAINCFNVSCPLKWKK